MCLFSDSKFNYGKTVKKITYSFFPFKIIVNGIPTVNNIPMVSIANPVGERISTPPMTCEEFCVDKKIINLWRMPNVLIYYFLQDTFVIFLNLFSILSRLLGSF